MGRASSGKKVARAASTGGGRVARGRRPWMWYGALSVVVLLGIVLVTTSRSERLGELESIRKVQPTPDDHWHAAYAFHICGVTYPPLVEDRDPQGIHTHQTDTGSGDGVIHIHPFTSQASGKNARLGKFFDAAGVNVTKTSLKLPGGKTYRNGDKCEGKTGAVRVKVDGKEYKGDPRNLRFTKDRMLITVAFAPLGTELPDPPSKVNLDNLSDVAPGSQSPAVTSEITPTSAASSEGTSAPGRSSATTAASTPASTTASTTESTTATTTASPTTAPSSP